MHRPACEATDARDSSVDQSSRRVLKIYGPEPIALFSGVEPDMRTAPKIMDLVIAHLHESIESPTGLARLDLDPCADMPWSY